MTDLHPVYTIVSNGTIDNIIQWLESVPGSYGHFRRILDSKREATNRFIVLCTRTKYRALKATKTVGMSISPAKLQDNNLPRKDQLWSFTIPVKGDDLENKLLGIVEFGLLPFNSWHIKYHANRSWCRLMFPNLSEEQVAIIKLVLDDTTWSNGEEFIIYWTQAKPVKDVKKIARRPLHSTPTPRQITPTK